jgi:hypothetical protein
MMAMRALLTLLLIAAVLLAGCRPPLPAAEAPLPAALDLKQLMEWVIDPTADVIWDSVKWISTEAGTEEIEPRSEEQWAAVRNAAATLMELGATLMVPGRARGDQEWKAWARALIATSDRALKAAEAKDKNAVFAAGGEIYNVCRGCHIQHAPHVVLEHLPLELAESGAGRRQVR